MMLVVDDGEKGVDEGVKWGGDNMRRDGVGGVDDDGNTG